MPLKEALPYLGITHRTAMTLIHKDEFPVLVKRVGGHWKVPRAALRRFLEDTTTEEDVPA